MKTVVLVLVLCAVLDVLVCGLLLVIVWGRHRRVRREAAGNGEVVPSAARPFGCLIALGVLGLVGLYGAGWLVLH